MITRTPRRFRHDALKAEREKVQFVNKHIDDANRIIFSDVVVEIFRKKYALPTILTFDKALHLSISRTIREF
jgi:hypothetical protein